MKIYLKGILTEKNKEKSNVFVKHKIYIGCRNPTFKKLLWVEFLVDKVPVGRIGHWILDKVLGFSLVVWG